MKKNVRGRDNHGRRRWSELLANGKRHGREGARPAQAAEDRDGADTEGERVGTRVTLGQHQVIAGVKIATGTPFPGHTRQGVAGGER